AMKYATPRGEGSPACSGLFRHATGWSEVRGAVASHAGPRPRWEVDLRPGTNGPDRPLKMPAEPPLRSGAPLPAYAVAWPRGRPGVAPADRASTPPSSTALSPEPP